MKRWVLQPCLYRAHGGTGKMLIAAECGEGQGRGTGELRRRHLAHGRLGKLLEEGGP